MACNRKIGPFDCCSVVQGDCLELMKSLPDGCVDAVITDPPYGLSDRNMRSCVAYMDVSWDVRLPDDSMREVIAAAPKAVIFGGNYYELPPSRGYIVWDKGASIQGRSWADCEMAWTNLDRVARIFRLTPANTEGKQHPTQKPIELMEWVVSNYTEEDDTILDPFCGSGTTLVAAKKLGRHFLGFEISEEYCRIARERLARIDAQPSLFQPKPEQLSL